MKNKNKRFAFWKYDRFPYMLGGEITKHPTGQTFYDMRAVYIPNYQGWIVPKFTLPYDEGKELLGKLEELTATKRKTDEVVHAGFVMQRNELLTSYGVKL